jgi:acetyltransferase-like isoleucine patch superfamily enzyme
MIKSIWMIRALVYKIFMGRFGFFSYLGKPCYLSGLKNIFFGKKVRIYPNARIEALGGEIHIGNDVSIGQNLHLICKSRVSIGARTTVSANVFISDVDHQYSDLDTHIMNQNLIVSHTVIGENCFLGYGSVILPGSKLGNQVVVGANSVVKGTFPDYCVIAGTPAKILKRYNTSTASWGRTDSAGNLI